MAARNFGTENLLRVIEELDDYAFLFIDRDGNIQTWNRGAEKIKGYLSEEIIGHNFRCFYTEEDLRQQKPDQLLQTALAEGKAQDEGWRIRKDGSRFLASVTIMAVRDDHGAIVGFGKLTRDLTQQRIAERAGVLEMRNRELEQFNYIASHDLQEPLRTVSNYIEILEEDHAAQLDDAAKAHLFTIKKATSRMRTLVRSLLGYSRLGPSSAIHEADCNVIMNHVLEDLTALIISCRATIKVSSLPVMRCYETEMRQLFQNLLVNALKFSKPDIFPDIRITVDTDTSFYTFHIADNGIGIDPKHFERIFFIFQRLNPTAQNEGDGIGLANCKKIAEMHGGTIWVDSAPGLGSTFHFKISRHL